MGDRAPEPPQAPIFNLNAYSPAEIQDSVETIGVKKRNSTVSVEFHAVGYGGR